MTISRRRINSLIKGMKRKGIHERYFCVLDYDDGSVGCNQIIYKDYEEFKFKNRITEADRIIRISWVVAERHGIE